MTSERITEVKNAVHLNEWAREYEAYRQSGMSVRKWCEERGISTSGFYHRLRKIRENLCEEYLPGQTVVPVRMGGNATVTVESDGVKVSINGNASAECIRAVIGAMKSC